MGKRKGRRNNGGGGGNKTHKNKQKSFGSVNGGGGNNYQMSQMGLVKFSPQRNTIGVDDDEDHYIIGYDGRAYGFDTSSDEDEDDNDDFWFRSQSPIFANKCRSRKRGKTGRFNDNADAQVAFGIFIRMILVQCLLDEDDRQKKRFIWKSIIISFLVIAFVMWYWWY